MGYELQSAAIMNGQKPTSGTFTVAENGVPQRNVFKGPFGDANAAINQFRQSFPGESGQRNELRGPGTFNIDLARHKNRKITEAQAVKLSWETFNLTNSPRFDVRTMQLNGNNRRSNNTSFGNFSSTLSNPRVIEFALRYTF
jgi:hypothetical protein